MKKHPHLIFTSTVIFLINGGCSSNHTPTEMDQVVANSPNLQIELSSLPLTAARSIQRSRGLRALSVGGCMAWAIRKEAKRASSDVKYLQCLYKKAAASGLLGLVAGSTFYFNLETPNADTPTKVVVEENSISFSLCRNNASEENVHITVQKSEDGYLASGTSVLSNEYSSDHFLVTVDTQTTGVEDISFVNHAVNQTTSPDCDGTSGTSTETDGTCFLRIEGNMINNEIDTSSPFSLFSGTFAEKNNTGVRTTAAIYSKFQDGTGASRYSMGFDSINADVNTNISSEAWTPANFETTADNDLVNDISSQSLSSRTLSLPAISDPWNCVLGSNEVSIDLDDISGMESCTHETLSSADLTNCTGGDAELAEVISGYLSDTNDPLTSSRK